MKHEYETWILNYLSRINDNGYGKCRQAAEEMREAFPELRIIRGHVFDGLWGQRAHWWLETALDEVVDPTARQFPHLLCYEKWMPGDEVLVGKCMECGEEIFEAVQSLDVNVGTKSFCNEACEKAGIEYIMGRADA